MLSRRKALPAGLEDIPLDNNEYTEAPAERSDSSASRREMCPWAGEGFDPVVTSQQDKPPALNFPVVALGASAGGLEAFTRVLQHLPPNTGMAFLLIQHLAPHHASQLASLLSRVSSMPVLEVEDETPVQPDHVFVIPPNKLMTISQGILRLAPRLPTTGVPMPIDHFFRSLAQDQRGAAVGVVLSGTDSDGALGLQAIREGGGITIAQSEESAKFSGMPHRAASGGPIDLILPPEEIASAIASIGQQRPPFLFNGAGRFGLLVPEELDEAQINSVLTLLRRVGGVDLRGYKLGTVRRRIARRMALQHCSKVAEYAALLETNETELRALHEDVLIKVTSFFRDPDVFQAFQAEVLPQLLDRPPNDPIRVWVPGCSTGEEVYSVAMCLVEGASQRQSRPRIQIFGTDLSERVLSHARNGIYQANQIAAISEERRQQFFLSGPSGYQIVKSVRELCVFARQNVCIDPPFSRLDLISCRNLLIYLGPTLQQDVVRTFHYALKSGAYLVLGSSETLRGFPELFASHMQHKIFRRSALERPSIAMVGRGFHQERSASSRLETISKPDSSNLDLAQAAERVILREYGPPWVIINDIFEIIHARGDTSPFLKLPAGAPSLELLKMARDSLRGELRKLLAKAKDEDAAVQSAVMREHQGGVVRIEVQVRRLQIEPSARQYFLVTFYRQAHSAEQTDEGSAQTSGEFERSNPNEVQSLREELAVTGQRLQAIIDERDAVNQELTSASEELQSSNEELQSINEELETAKEELQSSNEELNTFNAELQSRNRELAQLGDDLANLMSSTTLPILLLDRELRIRRMTPVAESILGIRPSDLGRPVGDIRMRLSVDEVESLARSVLLTLNPSVLELQDREGIWRELRVRPYRTADNRIEGIVLVFVEVDAIRRAEMAASKARQFAEAVLEAVQMPLLVLRGDLRVRFANRAFYNTYAFRPNETEDQLFTEIGGRQWDLPGLGAALTDSLTSQEIVRELEYESEFPRLGKVNLCIHLRSVQPEGERLVLVAVENITQRVDAAKILMQRQEQLKLSVAAGSAALRESETALLQSRGELRELAASLMNAQESERRRISRELHDDLSQKVAKLQFDIEILEQKVPFADVDKGKQGLQDVRDQTGALADDLRRVAHGLHPSSLDHLGLAVALRSYIGEFSSSTGIPVEFMSSDVPRQIPMQVATCLYRIVQEALRNVAKHAPEASVDIVLSGTPAEIELAIMDDGDGFDSSALRVAGGLGLISMQERVRLVQGRFSLSTQPGKGVHIFIHVPLPPGELNEAENTNS
jgi:two-component system CheB/CheR fusion protein